MKFASVRKLTFASVLFLSGFGLYGCSSESKTNERSATADSPGSSDSTAAAQNSEQNAKALPKTLEEAVNSSQYRTPENRKRDLYRHPLETLKFFGVRPEMTVVEISPGAGWYMEILAPFLAQNGQYIGARPPSQGSAYMTELNSKIDTWMKANPEVSSKVKWTVFDPPTQTQIAPEDSADLVVTFRNVHNWMSKGGEKAAFKSFYKALRPGGILGVVEHRADPQGKKDPKAKSGYVLESEIIRLATAAGFEFDAKSDVNANPKDTKDYPEGVWTLPPSLRLKDVDREKYLAIGESDRMTLKFLKPTKKKK